MNINSEFKISEFKVFVSAQNKFACGVPESKNNVFFLYYYGNRGTHLNYGLLFNSYQNRR